MKIQMPTPQSGFPVSIKAPMQDLNDMDVLCTIKIKIESQYLEHGFFKDQRSRCQPPNQEPPASSKAQNEDLNDMDVLCTLKIKLESKNLDH